MVTAGVARSGLCILRVESEADRLLITMTTERYAHRGLALTGEPAVRHFADPDLAIAAVAEFVRSHEPDHGAASGPMLP